MEGADREFPDHHAFTAGLFQGSGKKRALHDTPVDEKHFLVPVAAGIVPDSDIAFQDDAVHMPVNFPHGVQRLPAVNGMNGGGKLSVTGRMEKDFSAGEIPETDVRTAQDQLRDQFVDSGTFHGRLFHEVPADRRIEEQIPDDDGRAGRSGGFFN